MIIPNITQIGRGLVVIFLVMLAVQISSAAEILKITPPEEGSSDCFERGSVCNTTGYICSGTKNGRSDDACCPNGTKWDLGAGLCTPECVDEDFDGFGVYDSLDCRFNELDCDDSDSDVNPGAEEECFDSKDNNCDGEVDEGCGAISSSSTSSGDISDIGQNSTDRESNQSKDQCSIGICVNGDFDCDGLIDPGCATDSCNPTAEICDKIDNDCDGEVDDGVSCAEKCSSCGFFCTREACSSLGSCNWERVWYKVWLWGTCSDGAIDTYKTQEVCNGIDDDGDKEVDEGCINGIMPEIEVKDIKIPKYVYARAYTEFNVEVYSNVDVQTSIEIDLSGKTTRSLLLKKGINYVPITKIFARKGEQRIAAKINPRKEILEITYENNELEKEFVVGDSSVSLAGMIIENNKPLKNIQVKINYGDVEIKTVADDNGEYLFNIQLDEEITEYNLTIIFWNDYFKLCDYQADNRLKTYETTITLPTNKLYQEIELKARSKYFAHAYYYLFETVEFYMETLEFKDKEKRINQEGEFDHGLPEQIHLFSNFSTSHRHNSLSDNTFKASSIHFNRFKSKHKDPNSPDNRERHEFTHFIQYDNMEHIIPEICDSRNNVGKQQRCVGNHNGTLNPATTDSWIEGLAMFIPLVISDVLGEERPDQYAEVFSHDLESNYWKDAISEQGIPREDFAVTAVLWDIYDGKETQDGSPNKDDDDVEIDLATIWDILSSKHILPARYPSDDCGRGIDECERYIYYVSDLYELFRQIDTDVDEIFINHGFYMDSDENGEYDEGETIGQGDSSREWRY